MVTAPYGRSATMAPKEHLRPVICFAGEMRSRGRSVKDSAIHRRLLRSGHGVSGSGFTLHWHSPQPDFALAESAA